MRPRVTTAIPSPASIGVLYTGGTFGCAGQPLAPLSAAFFVPILRTQLEQLYATDWQIIDLDPLLDSSQTQPQHWLSILQHCLSFYQNQQLPIIVIHGTDTLAYTAAFLAEAFAGSDVRLCVTGSQRPLLDSRLNAAAAQIDPHSDALDNVRCALQAVLYAPAGVSVAFAGEHWPAQTCQKIHSQDLAAFTGHRRVGYPATSYQSLNMVQHQHWLMQAAQRLGLLQQTLSQIRLSVYYATPQPLAHLIDQLSDLIARQPDGLILIGYGLGNFPDHPTLRQLLMTAKEQGCLVLISTQVPFGGTATRYASGDWLAQVGVLPSAGLTLAAIYARLLWICATLPTATARRKRWMHCLNDRSPIKR